MSVELFRRSGGRPRRLVPGVDETLEFGSPVDVVEEFGDPELDAKDISLDCLFLPRFPDSSFIMDESLSKSVSDPKLLVGILVGELGF